MNDYPQAYRDYNKALSAAWWHFKEAIDPADRILELTLAMLEHTYNKDQALAKKNYEEAIIPATQVYEKAKYEANRIYYEARRRYGEEFEQNFRRGT